jgi:hypothetical protein
VDASSIRISILYDSNVILNSSMENIGRNKYAIFFTVSQPGPHEYKITAKDINGLKTTFHGDFDIP